MQFSVSFSGGWGWLSGWINRDGDAYWANAGEEAVAMQAVGAELQHVPSPQYYPFG